MSLIGDIVSRIFHSHKAEAAAPSAQVGAGAKPEAVQPVDINTVLNGMAKTHSERLNWQSSIVDLLKLLGLDSSLSARKQLAKELNYTGDTNDSATMNVWLLHQVMQKVAENGGKVPEELKH